jgi:hypothetical protein
MSTYEPGTVAVATVRGVPNVRVIRDDRKEAWLSGATIDGFQWHLERTHVTDVRPLIVLDIKAANPDANPEVALANLLGALNRGTIVCRGAARQIEQQTKPPRIPEPGLWGVVEAHPRTKGTRPVRFVRDSMSADEPWVAIADGSGWDWDDLIDPVLVRPGIEDGAS